MTASSLGNCRTITVYHVNFCACCIKQLKSKCELVATILLLLLLFRRSFLAQYIAQIGRRWINKYGKHMENTKRKVAKKIALNLKLLSSTVSSKLYFQERGS